jgi:hypothetical protein
LLLVSLFGVSVLADTSRLLYKMFSQSAASYSGWSGGCGGGVVAVVVAVVAAADAERVN